MSDNSGSAYPLIYVGRLRGEDIYGKPGLTKRELFAAMALQGAMANQEYLDECAEHAIKRNASEILATACVAVADALLAELAK